MKRASIGDRLAVLIFLLIGAFDLCAAADLHRGIFFETRGAGDTVVFIHGGQMDRRMWDGQFDTFARHYKAVRYDIRGFGKSPAPTEPYSHAEDLRSLLQHLKIERASLVGLSLGAAIAVDFAILHPAKVEKLVLACPGLGGFRFNDKANDLRSIVEAARDEGPAKAAELWLQNPYMSVAMENKPLQSRLRRLSLDNGRCWLNNPVLQRHTKPAAAERLAEVKAPTLVIDGARDVSDIHEIVGKLSTEIKGATKVAIPDCGHIAPMEKPEKFNKLVLEFLARQ